MKNNFKVEEEELVGAPSVKCCICNKECTKGLHRVKLVPKDKTQTPAIMERRDLYMCFDCFKEGKKWPQ